MGCVHIGTTQPAALRALVTRPADFNVQRPLPAAVLIRACFSQRDIDEQQSTAQSLVAQSLAQSLAQIRLVPAQLLGDMLGDGDTVDDRL